MPRSSPHRADRDTVRAPRPRARRAPSTLRAWLLACLAGAPLWAFAQTGGPDGSSERSGAGEPQRLDTVVIRADRSLEERFASTGSRVTVMRNDIELMGADTIADVLRQLPGVQTSGAASGNVEIRMRGMDRSATQILIDGQRIGSGRASAQLPFDQLPADMIERIEVLRSPSAEYSGATGGTINIVMREAMVRRERNIRFTDQHAFGRDALQGFFSSTGPLNEPPPRREGAAATEPVQPYLPWSYFIAVASNKRLWGNDLRRQTDQGGADAYRTVSDERLRGHTQETSLMPRINARLSARDTVILRATLLGAQSASRLLADSAGLSAAGTVLGGQVAEIGDSDRSLHQLRADWTHRFDRSRMEARLSGERTRETIGRDRLSNSVSGGVPTLTETLFADRRRERSLQASVKLTGTEGSHVWMGGAELELRRLDVGNDVTVVGEPLQARRYESSLERRVIWAQNEWGLPGRTTLTAGLRVESLVRESRYDGLEQSESHTRLQPSLHTRTPINENLQFRLNLARTSRIPALTDVIDRVVPSYGVNSPTRPDTVGNPALKAESTLSLDAGVERRLAPRGQAGLNLFVRAIDDLIIRRTTEVNGRWQVRPENLGRALVWGLEGDLKTDLAALGAPLWNLSVNGSLLKSRLQDDLGYSGRIPGQAHYLLTMNLARPMPRGGGFFGGGSISLTGASDIGSNTSTRGREHAYVSLDAFIGQLVPGLGYWRLGVSNLTNARKNRERVDVDALGATRAESSVERYQTRVFLSVGTRW